MLLRFLVSILVASICVGCTIPDDPHGTLQRVQGHTLRVGLVLNEPWIKQVNGAPAGVEVALVDQFAVELDADIAWVWGTEDELMEALEHFELDLVIAGLTQPTPWQDAVGLTSPYFTNRIVVGVPPAMSPPQDLEGVSIMVQQGDVIAAYVEAKDAVPVRVDDPSSADGPVAAAEWQLEHWGFTVTDMELHSEPHVIAVPPGENRWLMRLEQFLQQQRTQVPQLLQQEAQ